MEGLEVLQVQEPAVGAMSEQDIHRGLMLEAGPTQGFSCYRCVWGGRATSTRLMDTAQLMHHGKQVHHLQQAQLHEFVNKCMFESRDLRSRQRTALALCDQNSQLNSSDSATSRFSSEPQRLSALVLGPGGDIAIDALLGKYKSEFRAELIPNVEGPTAKLFRRYTSGLSRFPDHTSNTLPVPPNEEWQGLSLVTDHERKNPDGLSQCFQLPGKKKVAKERLNLEVAYPNDRDSMLDVNGSNDYPASSGACEKPQIRMKEQQGQGQGNKNTKVSERLDRKRYNSDLDRSIYDLQLVKRACASRSTIAKRRKTVVGEHPDIKSLIPPSWHFSPPCFTNDGTLNEGQNAFDINLERNRRQSDFVTSQQKSSLSGISSNQQSRANNDVGNSALAVHNFQVPTYTPDLQHRLADPNPRIWSPAFLSHEHTSNSYWGLQQYSEAGNSQLNTNNHAHSKNNLQQCSEKSASDNMGSWTFGLQEHSILEQLESRPGTLWIDAANKTKDAKVLMSSQTYSIARQATFNSRAAGHGSINEQDSSVASWKLEDYFQPGELGDFDMSVNTLVGAENLSTGFETIMIDKTANEIFYGPLDTFDPRPTMEAKRANEKQSIDNGYRNILMPQNQSSLDHSIHHVQEPVLGDEPMTDEELDALLSHFVQISPNATGDWEGSGKLAS